MALRLGKVLLVSAGLGTTIASAADGSSFSEAISETQPIVEARVRYETVEQDGFVDRAQALTFRGRLGFQTGVWRGFKATGEIEFVEDLVDEYNSTTNGNTQFPVIADPDVTELNRLQLLYTGIPNTQITVGRQRINLDDQRFIGAVGWRQDDQTFDAIRIQNTSIQDVSIDVTYIDQVNTIFGDDQPRGKIDSESILANAKFMTSAGNTKLTLTGFAYLLEFDEAPTQSSQTYGFLATLKSDHVSLKASFATQSDYRSQPADYSAEYYLVEAGTNFDRFSAGLGYEVLTGDGTIGFATPLATLHKFNGFDDRFLNTPATGLEDLYFRFGYSRQFEGPIKRISATAIYHDFSAHTGPFDSLGEELNLVGSLSLDHITLLIKYSDFSGTGLVADREKFWAEAAFKL